VVGIEALNVDELVHEKCVECEKLMERNEVELKRVVQHGLQWVCKGGCESGTIVSRVKGGRILDSGDVSAVEK